MIMRKLQKKFNINGGGYAPPQLTLVETSPEEGFAGSLDTWNNGTISDDKSHYNEWGDIL